MEPNNVAMPALLIFAIGFIGLMLIPIAIGAFIDFKKAIKRRLS